MVTVSAAKEQAIPVPTPSAEPSVVLDAEKITTPHGAPEKEIGSLTTFMKRFYVKMSKISRRYPTNKELGEGSSVAASKILPVTGEPIHRTIPLLAARLVRHEDRLDAIATLVNNIPNEQVEVMSAEIEQLVMEHLEMGAMMQQLNTQFGEAMEFIGLLCSANTINRDIMYDIDQALDTTRAQVMSLRRAQQEAQARERDRDQIIETMAAKIQELERRLDDNQRKP
ncbi:hypothetical protein CTI12_AA024350 [Artemisia annua]|uniref:Uncharacterized protein n=1 Tax=Artemisia annua TaxID=35608 RepID=A0A2U1QIW8_ARTAN|nr:hypothetical protein CTI12_AA024350 [Artemisia annua]